VVSAAAVLASTFSFENALSGPRLQALKLLNPILVKNAQYDAIKRCAILCARSRIVKRRFPGDFNNFQQVVSVIGVGGEWRKRANHYQYRATTGAVLNWWKSTGTIMFQGPGSAAKDLEAAFLSVTTVIEEELTGWIRC
jgi:hypothetical protein